MLITLGTDRISDDTMYSIHTIRKQRNRLVHRPDENTLDRSSRLRMIELYETILDQLLPPIDGVG